MRKLILYICSLLLATPAMAQRDRVLEEIVVTTGTGTAHTLKDVPVQTEVISRQMLEQFGGSSIEDILSALSASFSFNEGDMGSQIQMNGLGNDYILILIDGKRIHGDNGGQNDLSLIDPARIERIEIVKGASSALYGSDAIAGVINIITKRPERGFMVENKTRVGSYADVRQHNAVSLTLGRLQSLTNFQLQHTDGWQNTATEDQRKTGILITDSRNKTVNEHTNWQVSQRFSYKPTKQVELYAEGSIYRKRIYRPSGKYPSTDVHTYDLLYHNRSLSAGGSWRLGATDIITLDVDWNRHAYDHYFTAITLTDGYDPWGHFTPYYPYFPDDVELQSDQRRTIAHLKGVFELPFSNRLSAGAEWRYDWLRAPMRVAGGKAEDNTEALYVQDEFNLLNPLQITAGLRLNRNEQFGLYLTPKLSAMLRIGDNIRLRATWSEGFKAPTPKELRYRYVRYMSGTYLFLGNADLKPQTSDYFSLGGEITLGPLNLTATAYYNDVKRMITLVTIPNTQAPAVLITQYDPIKTRQYMNLESAKTYGIDLNARLTLAGSWAAGVGYSYLNTDARVFDTNHDRIKNVTIDGMANHKGNLFVTWKHRFGSDYQLGAGLYGRFSSKRYYQIDGDGKGYQLWRLTTTHDFGSRALDARGLSLRVEAGIDNILNYVDRTPHGLHLGTTSPGRTVFASFSLRFKKGKQSQISTFHSTLKQSNNEED